MAEKGFSKSTVAKCNDRVRLSPTEDEVAKLFTGRGRGARGEATPCFYPLFLAGTEEISFTFTNRPHVSNLCFNCNRCEKIFLYSINFNSRIRIVNGKQIPGGGQRTKKR